VYLKKKVSLIAHETAETFSDPGTGLNFQGWFDSTGAENGDK